MTDKEKISELLAQNQILKKQLEDERNKKSLKDELFIQQSKMATMGEMVGNIAHQWRQPLMEISSILMSAESKIHFEKHISNEELLELFKKSNEILKYLSHTIDDFRSFYSKDKQAEPFKVVEQIKRVVNILSHTLQNKNIKVNVIVKNNSIVNGYKNEYAQVLLNLISNAQDALSNRSIKDGKIDVLVYEEEGKSITKVLDNAGGIKDEYINEIFKPFATYEKKNGNGIGLFMSKLIIENNMQGKLEVENQGEGAMFSISLPCSA